MQVEILRRKDRYNGAESYLEIRQDGEGQGTVGSVNLRGLPGLHRQHFQGSGGVTFHFYALAKEMATHSSVLAWRIPGTGEPGGLPSMGSHRIGHD